MACASGLGGAFSKMEGSALQPGATEKQDFARLVEIKAELAKLPKATGKNRHIGGVKWGLYSEKRRIQSRLARRLGSHTNKEWLEIVARQQGRCAKCNEKRSLTKDHIIPISKNGSNAAKNIQGLCGSCNSKKGARYE